MSLDDAEPREQWEAMLRTMLADHRLQNPNDTRDDREVLISLMEYFVKMGYIKKIDGKYAMPRIKDLDAMLKLFADHQGPNN